MTLLSTEQRIDGLQNPPQKTVNFSNTSRLSKSGKKEIVLHGLDNRKIYKSQVGCVNYFSKQFVDFRKIDLSPKLKENWLSFALSLARLLIYKFIKSDKNN